MKKLFGLKNFTKKLLKNATKKDKSKSCLNVLINSRNIGCIHILFVLILSVFVCGATRLSKCVFNSKNTENKKTIHIYMYTFGVRPAVPTNSSCADEWVHRDCDR